MQDRIEQRTAEIAGPLLLRSIMKKITMTKIKTIVPSPMYIVASFFPNPDAELANAACPPLA
jgi:hypothetical protein